MKRVELIACEAVQKELIDRLEKSLPDIEYTLLTQVQGKGKKTRKDGSQVWPELNFMLLCYLEDEKVANATAIIQEVARLFPKEGIFAAVSDTMRIK